MNSEISLRKSSKRKSEITKLLESLKRILGIQLETKGEGDNVKHITKRIMEKFHNMACHIEELESQIQKLIRSNGLECNLQKKLLEQQREIAALKSSTGREKLIIRQRRQIAELKLEIIKLHGEKDDMRQQFWSKQRLEGIGL